MEHIFAAGNTWNPCLIVLSSLGFDLRVVAFPDVNYWCATRAELTYFATAPTELLGAVTAWDAIEDKTLSIEEDPTTEGSSIGFKFRFIRDNEEISELRAQMENLLGASASSERVLPVDDDVFANAAMKVLKKRNYRIYADYIQHQPILWCASSGEVELGGTTPQEVLGLVRLWETFGDDWCQQEPDLYSEIMDQAIVVQG
jgi:hypothetical protein